MTKTSDRKLEPATVSLAVYGARAEEEGDVWNKDYGLLFVPDDWEWLPSGDAYLTRTVKKLGPAWVLRKPNRKRRYTATLGVYAPAGNILRAKALAAETRAPRSAPAFGWRGRRRRRWARVGQMCPAGRDRAIGVHPRLSAAPRAKHSRPPELRTAPLDGGNSATRLYLRLSRRGDGRRP